jgi:hypothetical protein
VWLISSQSVWVDQQEVLVFPKSSTACTKKDKKISTIATLFARSMAHQQTGWSLDGPPPAQNANKNEMRQKQMIQTNIGLDRLLTERLFTTPKIRRGSLISFQLFQVFLISIPAKEF